MAIKSPINPQTIVKERPTSAPAAMNFISGGSPMGSSIVSSAANKIVGFQRGAAAVAPKAPDLGSIIKTLSTNILNNVESKVQSINQNVSNIVNQTLKTFSKDYQDRSKEVDTAKPSGILANFLKSYQQAMGFIQFLGNRKNIKTLGDNLQSLQRVFSETFQIATIIRQTIVKIVKQLSNLPTASSGAGGLNMDINVPGGMLRRTAPRGVMTALKLAGAGAAVAGGGMAVNAIGSAFDGGGEVQAAQSSSSEGLSGPMLDRFNVILDRFSAAIDSLSKKKSAPAAAPLPSGGGGTTEKKDPAAPPPGGAGAGAAAMPGTDQDLYTLATIASLEGGNAQAEADVAQAVYNRMEKGGKSATEILTAPGQFEPAFTAPYKISKGKVSEQAKNIRTFEDAVNFRVKKYGEKRSTAENAIRSTIANIQNPTLQANAASFVGSRTSFRANANSYGRLSNSVWRGTNDDNQYLNEERSKGTAAVPTFVSGSGKPGITAASPPKPGVAPASTPAATQQQIAQTVAQPAQQQQQSQVTVAPMNMSTPQAQAPASSGGGSGQMSSGRQSPPMGASNDDNFFILYSKMVYSIVDG